MHDSPLIPTRAPASPRIDSDPAEPGQAYEALRRSEERFRLLVQGITD